MKALEILARCGFEYSESVRFAVHGRPRMSKADYNELKYNPGKKSGTVNDLTEDIDRVMSSEGHAFFGLVGDSNWEMVEGSEADNDGVDERDCDAYRWYRRKNKRLRGKEAAK